MPPRNLPNLITGARLLLAVVLFLLLGALDHARASDGGRLAGWALRHEQALYDAGLGIFMVAAASDVLDGWIARRWGLTTDFGRIVDPFADKVIVCGSFVLLIPLPGSQVQGWMVVVILGRELLVDGLRGFAEARGVKFPAVFSGKAKMMAQCACLTWVLFALGHMEGVSWAGAVSRAALWGTVAITVISGCDYVLRARRVLRADTLAVLTADRPEARPGKVAAAGPEAVRP